MKRRHFLSAGLMGLPAWMLPVDVRAGSLRVIRHGTDDDFTETRKRLSAEAQFGRKKGVNGKKGIAVSSHPLVSHEAVKILEAGGNAADAALAASMVQAVVEPHMTTLTGVFSMLYHDAAKGKTTHVNGSCNAPLATKREDFPLAKITALAGTAKGALVPGFWGGFETAHKQFGRLPIKKLTQSAIRYAREGFEVNPFLWGEIFEAADKIAASDDGREIYFRDKGLIRPGELLVQRKLADVITRLSEEESRYFYHGEFARNYCKTVQAAGGIVTEEDFARYEAMIQEPVEGTFRGYTIKASPAPDYGGELLVEMFQLAELFDFSKYGPICRSYESTLKAMQIIGEVISTHYREHLAYKVTPLETRLSKSFTAERFARLKGKPMTILDPPPKPGSNHLTVVDKDGNVATVLHSVMSMPWSNTLFTDGVSICAAVLHYASGVPDPGQRIQARIGPNIFFKDGKPLLASGSPSVSLLDNIFQNTINILDFGMVPEESVHLPRFGGYSLNKPGSLLIENDYDPDIIKGIEKLGINFDKVRPWQFHMGSFEGVYIDPAGTRHACGDPRRAGQAKVQ
jgi:gamma-glutamyltranspeptidase/glutathione hydrolase